MRATYDVAHDIAYIYFEDAPPPPGSVAQTSQGRTLIPLGRGNFSLLNLDWDNEGRLLGIEVAPASRLLPAELLQHAEAI